MICSILSPEPRTVMIRNENVYIIARALFVHKKYIFITYH